VDYVSLLAAIDFAVFAICWIKKAGMVTAQHPNRGVGL
jgi:hypothetical protein